MHQQSQHEGDQIHSRAQSVEGSAFGGAKGLATDVAVIALLLLAEECGYCPGQPFLCWTVEVVSELGLRVHAAVPPLTRLVCIVWRRSIMTPPFSSYLFLDHTLLGCYR